MITSPQKTVSVSDKDRTRKGMTLVEVMLSAAILAIMAIMVTTALFYPNLLVVNSGLEQSAIHAGIGELEGYLNDFENPALAEPGQFNTGGWDLEGKIDTPPALLKHDDNDLLNNPLGLDANGAEYVEIRTTINYRAGKTVELVTYRSLEVSSSER